MYRLLLLLVSLHLARSSLPTGWKACNGSSSDFTNCLRKEIGVAISSLREGSRKFSITPLDPLKFKKFNIDQASGPVAIKLTFADFNFAGLSRCNLESAEIKNDWKTLFINGVYIDQIITTGSYKIDGKILILPILGEGFSKLVWQNMTVDVKIEFRDVVKKNNHYLEVSKFSIDLKPKKVIFRFDNLFKGDKALGDTMNMFLNNNWKEIINELMPSIRKSLSLGFTVITNQVFSKIQRNEVDIK